MKCSARKGTVSVSAPGSTTKRPIANGGRAPSPDGHSGATVSDHEWQIGICGTFDVENYGDLLFPLIAEAELSPRLGRTRLHPFSYSRKAPPDWPFAVRSLADLPEAARSLDGVIIGGGDLIRFDKDVAPGYYPPTPAIHHPTGYWLTPALIALLHGRPVAWNAPGVCGEIPAWAEPLMRLAIGHSRYVAVRDERSQRVLAPFAPKSGIEVVPDTAFGVASLVDGNWPDPDLAPMRGHLGITDRYIVVQAVRGLDAFCRLVNGHAERFRDYKLLVLPIGPALGDDPDTLAHDLPGAIRLPAWPSPLALTELIGGASAAVGISLHLSITALAFGVPVFRPTAADGVKYAVLSDFGTVARFPSEGEIDPQWFTARLGRTEPEPAIRAARARLSGHWDRMAAALTDHEGDLAAQSAVGQLWQWLPDALEAAAIRHAAVLEERQAAVTERQAAEGAVAARDEQIAARNEQVAALRKELAALYDSRSWKVTAPLRSVRQGLRRVRRREMIDLARIERHPLETHPYQWAFVNNLFRRRDAAALTASYPRDHFKTVTGYDGEKGYSYEARSLVHMGADTVSEAEALSAPWRELAADLLSPAYRRAMSRLTGCDLTEVPIEVNVFHYGPGAWLGPHVDLKDKIVTHVLYFNEVWDERDGGCLTILRSSDASDTHAAIAPIIGNSSVLVRSDNSWHAVSRVAPGCRRSRRSLTVTFYRPGSISTMWPPGDVTPLHRYEATDEEPPARPWARWRRFRTSSTLLLRTQLRTLANLQHSSINQYARAPCQCGSARFRSPGRVAAGPSLSALSRIMRPRS